MTDHVQTSERTVANIGESGILQVILPIFKSQGVVLGPGDDAGVLQIGTGEVLVTVDTIVEDQDFRLKWPSGAVHEAFDIGWKSAAQNLSDINAMGGQPTGVVISLSLPGETSIGWVEDFARGFAQALRQLSEHPIAVLGGDLGLSKEISVTTTALGETSKGRVLRSGAKPGNVVAVAGRVGMASAGLALLDKPDSEHSWSRALRRVVQGQCRPVPPLESGPRAAEAGATAMLDLSDGLMIDAQRLATASEVTLALDSQPLADFARRLQPAADFLGEEAMQWVLYGGEDFGLLATFPKDATIPEEFSIIGKVATAGSKGTAITIDGEQMSTSEGFDHFS